MDKLNSTIQQGIGGNLVQGMMGNLTEATPESLMQEYGAYLMEGESIQMGFKLVRDVVIFTNCRIIDFDKQGATGQKARVKSIYLNSIVEVSAETAGFGLDDSEITVHYISSPYFRANGGVSVSERKFEFPKKYQIQSLYKYLQEVAFANHESINK
jgi:hypothetical protein